VTCNYITNVKQNYERHLSSQKHQKHLKHKQIGTNEKCDEYMCVTCNYITNVKEDYKKHLSSKIHLLREFEKKIEELDEENEETIMKIVSLNGFKNIENVIENYLNSIYPPNT